MANEITFTSKLNVTENGVTVTNATQSKTTSIDSDMVDPDKTHHTQKVGTTEEALVLNDVDDTSASGDEYVVRLENRHATAVVTVKIAIDVTAGPPATYSIAGKMRPGEPWGPVRMPKKSNDTTKAGGIYLVSDTALTPVEVVSGAAGVPD